MMWTTPEPAPENVVSGRHWGVSATDSVTMDPTGATVPAPGKAIGEVAADAPVPVVAPESEEPAAFNGVPVGVGGDA